MLTSVPAASNIYTDTSCYRNSTYVYRITADNSIGSSAPSAAASATTLGTGANPTLVLTSLSATATSPYTVNVSWTDSVTTNHDWAVERSSNGQAYSIIALVNGSTNNSGSYTDTLLNPSSTYSYRVRVLTGSEYGNYIAPTSATTPARPTGAANIPTNVAVVDNSATNASVTWTDTNGGTATYVVETASFAWTGAPVYTVAGTTARGATSFSLTTTAETFYYVRVHAISGTGVVSGNSVVVNLRTASAGTAGGPKVYQIGPGKAYTSLAALDWTKLGPGDTVQIFPNKDSNGNIIPYYEKPLISTRGTAAAPITIVGVADPATGQMPIIDGTNAVTSPQWSVSYMPLDDLSLVMIGRRLDQNSQAWSPGFLNFSNVEIRNGYDGDPGTTPNTYTAFDGTKRNYQTTSAIYVVEGDHITISDCNIHGKATTRNLLPPAREISGTSKTSTSAPTTSG